MFERFPVFTTETAPTDSRATLVHLEKTLGVIPNLAAAMAGSPSLIKGFAKLREVYYEESSLSPVEVQVLSLTNAYENRCRYCMAIHSAFAVKEGLSEESLAALREGQPPVEPRLRALSDLSRALIQTRGQVGDGELEAFCEAGFTPAQALEVVLGVAVSILANYSHHLTEAPVDRAFSRYAWTPPETPAGVPVPVGAAAS
ncbi:MAG: carboxymuconolactone decarboxylase family protein [Acidobacteria bacterium]|nr:carboxymuconolactone decarboxylase family protein [Acidobacteriota bacterium]